MINSALHIKKTDGKGRGVFTLTELSEDMIIEESPVIVMTLADREQLDKTLLHDYIFEWGANNERCCMALGYIAVYNHSYESNAEYFMDFEKEIIEVRTVRMIKEGEEITINYNGDWNNAKKVWFDVK